MQLSKEVQGLLRKGLKNGFAGGVLDLSFMKIDDSGVAELCEWIIKVGDKVDTILFECNSITSIGASMIFNMLKTTNSSIRRVHLKRQEKLDDEYMKSLGEYIKANDSIQSIAVNNTQISDRGIMILAPYVYGSKTLKEVYFDDNIKITNKSIPYLTKMIESSSIEDMRIKQTSITQRSILAIPLACNSIVNKSPRLDLSYIDINDSDLNGICQNMRKYGVDNLNEIFFVKNKIGSEGSSTLFNTLTECHAIVSNLNLTANDIGDEAMVSLAEFLQGNQHLTHLQLSINSFTDKGVEILSQSLIGNKVLQELSLGYNPNITDKSVPYLVDIATKSCIIRIEIWDTSISKESSRTIMNSLHIPIEQRGVPIRSNIKSAAKASISASVS